MVPVGTCEEWEPPPRFLACGLVYCLTADSIVKLCVLMVWFQYGYFTNNRRISSTALINIKGDSPCSWLFPRFRDVILDSCPRDAGMPPGKSRRRERAGLDDDWTRVTPGCYRVYIMHEIFCIDRLLNNENVSIIDIFRFRKHSSINKPGYKMGIGGSLNGFKTVMSCSSHHIRRQRVCALLH